MEDIITVGFLLKVTIIVIISLIVIEGFSYLKNKS